MMLLTKKDKYLLLLLSLLYVCIVAWPRISFPDLDHGDEFSDAAVLSSGENFVKFGFIKCRFLPVAEPHLDAPKDPYTHFPPMSDITNGLLRKILKTDSLRVFRALPLCLSLVALLLWYLFIKGFSGSSVLAFLAALFYFTNPSFIYGADSLYENAYSDFIRIAIFYLYLLAFSYPAKRKNIFFLLFLLTALATTYTFEYIVYLGLFLFGLRYFYPSRQRVRVMRIFIAMASVLLAMGLHLIQNAWYFGSFSAALRDLSSVALERFSASRDSPLGALTLLNWIKYVLIRYISIAFIFEYYLLLVFGIFFFALYQYIGEKSRKESRRMFGLFLLLFICGISWYVLFPSHSLAHTFIPFLPRHLLPAAALYWGLGCFIAYRFIRENNPKNIAGKVILAMMIIAVSISGILKSELPVTKDKRMLARDFIVFKKCLLGIRHTDQTPGRLGVNYYRYPFMRYYTNRVCITIFNTATIEGLKALPEYFLFIPQNNEENMKLYQLLTSKYDLLFKCESQRFPSLFFRIK